ncbi:uncharacterized protein LOC128559422 [Mercenaria mercenaria]|uniref:uncharacterized protein LOC128559422 n=1 Tax=Mercenaria mercenaria TaxID=6596 RepID=UPI00234F4B19|nr:uncharacterized protein LOC128559422 [Mercenaria mercenaria]
MAQKPSLPPGYLGAQPKFAELGLSALSNIDSEIVADNNELEIKIKFKDNVKVTHQLINTRDEKDISDFVFTQTYCGTITFIIHLPESGYYKFQIFALSENDESKSLPNVYNYLINCTQALTPVFPFPKQYAQWKNGCYLHKPLVLHKEMPLRDIFWKVVIPDAKAVAVVADGEWFHLEKKGNHFEGSSNLDPFKGKDTKVTVKANFGPDESKYSTMLQYNL